MRMINTLFIAVVMMVVLTACGSNDQSESLADYGTGDNGQYVYLTIDDKVFVPFSAVNNSDRGAQIGIVNGDGKDKIFEFKGLSPDEWIIEYYELGEMDGSMLLREENVTEFPEGFHSEYEWNQFVTEESCVSEKPEAESTMEDYPQMVMVNGVVYQSTGYNSSAVGCGMMDGHITSTVDSSELPTKDDQSNFGVGYDYQYGGEGQLIVVMDDNWVIFRDINSDDTSIPEQVLNFAAKVKEVREDNLLVSFIDMPGIFRELHAGDYVVEGTNMEDGINEGDYVRVWCDGFIEETLPARIPSVYQIEKIDKKDIEPDFVSRNNAWENPIGLSTYAKDVTSAGCTLVFVQSGGNVKEELQTGQEFELQVKNAHGDWVDDSVKDTEVG